MPPPPLSRRRLCEGWELHLRTAAEDAPAEAPEGPVPAVVPGTVHTDLLRAGVLADPQIAIDDDGQHWIGRSRWAYTTTIDWTPEGYDRVELVADGLDTVAEVVLNGASLATTRNMHRRHRIDVTEHLRAGDNDLEIVFHPVHAEVDRVRDEVGVLPATVATHYPYVRKMACNFGWDWGPIWVTAGIWRDISVESWSSARLGDVRLLATVVGTRGHLEVEAPVHRSRAAQALALRVTVGDAVVTSTVEGNAPRATVGIDEVRRWWPVGFGDPYLYDVTVELLAAGVVLDRVKRRVGFRTVGIREEPDAVGSTWETIVNGQRVSVRGFNWIPDRPFPSEVDAARYARRIDQALDANANLLRVWGGGIFEAEAFYAACDERGVLVWQDFLFACAAYPETDEYRGEVEAEARQAIAERAHHPSLVLWNGNNECTWGYHDWGWQEVLGTRPWGAGYYGELLPRLLAELDPTRPYLPGSPSSGDLDASPNADDRGVSHIWDVWNERDYVHYRDRRPAFVAEFGFCAPPAWATLRRAVPEGELTLDNPAVRHHMRALDGPDKLRRRLAEHFPEPSDADDWHWWTQLNQARALTFGVDHLRSLERCSGAVVWQLNDCWPVISWAAVDGDERRKPSWYALRAAFAPRRVVVQPHGSGLALVALNDDAAPWRADAVVRRLHFDGSVLAEASVQLPAPATGIHRVPLAAAIAVPADRRRELLVVDVDGGQRTTWFWERDTDLAYPPARWDAEVTPADDGISLRVTAATLVRDLAVFPDRLLVDGEPLGPEAVASELLLTLLPGETAEVLVAGAGLEHAEAVVRRPVLRAANDVGALFDRSDRAMLGRGERTS